MSKRQFSEEAQLRGVRGAIKVLREAKRRGLRGKPVWLIPSLERREVELELSLRRRARGHSGFGI